MKKFYEGIMALISILIGLWLALSQPEKWKALMKIINDKNWLIHFAMVVIFSGFMFLTYDNNQLLITSIKRGLMSLLIALFGEVGLTIAPFWTIFAVSYFMDDWI